MPQLKVNDLSMYYEQHGQGEPIVFIPGFSADCKVWEPIVSLFARKYQVILLDNRGAGQTRATQNTCSIDQMANDVASLCDHLGIRRAHIVGNSMGGFITQTLAHQYPKLVRTAVICNSSSHIKTVFTVFLEAQLQLLEANAPLEALYKASLSWAMSYPYLSQPGILEQMIQLNLDNPYPFSIDSFKAQYAAMSAFDSTDWLQEITTPTLVIGADRDIILPEKEAQFIAQEIPNAEYYLFTDCGHLSHIEYPEQFTKVVQQFIERY